MGRKAAAVSDIFARTWKLFIQLGPAQISNNYFLSIQSKVETRKSDSKASSALALIETALKLFMGRSLGCCV